MSIRDSLPSDAENYDVWCERCQRVHPYYAMTRERHDALIAEKAREIADAIDAKALTAVLAEWQR